MKPRQKKFAFIIAGLVAVAAAVGLVMYSLKNNVSLYFTPTQVYNKEAPQSRNFRIGGLVEQGSVKRQKDGLTVHFSVTDNARSMPVVYKGILPDLFKEGKGVVVHGKLEADIFQADEVLAKHDENYMPPEAADALAKAAKAQSPTATSEIATPAALKPTTK